MPEDSKQTNYHNPPRITRVVLRRDQAILSACSTSKTSNGSSTNTACLPVGCGKEGLSPLRDNQGSS